MRGYDTYGPVPARLGFIAAALFEESSRRTGLVLCATGEKVNVADLPSTSAE